MDFLKDPRFASYRTSTTMTKFFPLNSFAQINPSQNFIYQQLKYYNTSSDDIQFYKQQSMKQSMIRKSSSQSRQTNYIRTKTSQRIKTIENYFDVKQIELQLMNQDKQSKIKKKQLKDLKRQIIKFNNFSFNAEIFQKSIKRQKSQLNVLNKFKNVVEQHYDRFKINQDRTRKQTKDHENIVKLLIQGDNGYKIKRKGNFKKSNSNKQNDYRPSTASSYCYSNIQPSLQSENKIIMGSQPRCSTTQSQHIARSTCKTSTTKSSTRNLKVSHSFNKKHLSVARPSTFNHSFGHNNSSLQQQSNTHFFHFDERISHIVGRHEHEIKLKRIKVQLARENKQKMKVLIGAIQEIGQTDRFDGEEMKQEGKSFQTVNIKKDNQLQEKQLNQQQRQTKPRINQKLKTMSNQTYSTDQAISSDKLQNSNTSILPTTKQPTKLSIKKLLSSQQKKNPSSTKYSNRSITLIPQIKNLSKQQTSKLQIVRKQSDPYEKINGQQMKLNKSRFYSGKRCGNKGDDAKIDHNDHQIKDNNHGGEQIINNDNNQNTIMQLQKQQQQNNQNQDKLEKYQNLNTQTNFIINKN